jgi:hypothetical protein
MRNFKLFGTFLALGLFVASCGDNQDEFPINPDEATNGAFMRIINAETNSFEFDLLNIPTSEFAITLEASEVFGTEFQSVDFGVTFVDNTPDNGTTVAPRVSLGSFSAAQFAADANTGLLRSNFVFQASDVLAALGITEADIFGGDSFDFDWTMNLADGRSFNADNTGGDITGGAFFRSPFFRRVNAICVLTDGFMVGTYNLEETLVPNAPWFGSNTRFADGPTEVAVGETPTQRTFPVLYIGYALELTIDLVCETVIVPEQPSGLGCGNGPLTWATNINGTYDLTDDSVVIIELLDDADNGCGLTGPVQLTMTR